MNRGIGRRAFLRRVSIGAALLAASRLRLGPAELALAQASTDFRVLSATDLPVMTAIADRMVDTGNPAMPRFRETSGLQVIDVALSFLPDDQKRDFHWGLWLFEYGPAAMTGEWSRFTKLDPPAQDAYISAWADSRFAVCRLGFDAFKNLSMLGYYSQDGSWPGIHYDGPWVPRPRRSPDQVL